MKKVVIALGTTVLAGIAIVSFIVESEGKYFHESLGGDGRQKALILFHPSRDARFSDDLSRSVSDGLRSAGFTVERATMTQDTPAHLESYAIVAVVSNTYYWTPDLPTLRYLKRARLDGVAAIGLIGGFGATARSRRILDEALRETGAKVLQTRAFWLLRPNDEQRPSNEQGMDMPNRSVALQLAEQFGAESGQAVSGGVSYLP